MFSVDQKLLTIFLSQTVVFVVFKIHCCVYVSIYIHLNIIKDMCFINIKLEFYL